MNENKVGALDGVRGLAALLVVLFHLPGWHRAYYDIPLIRNGYLMVELFFVLSGYVIFKSYAHRLTNFRACLRFQFLRWGRLYPVHLAALLVFLSIEFAKLFAARRLGIHSPNSAPFLQNSWSAFRDQLFLVQAIGTAGHEETFNGPAWSISVEFYTYLLFALLAVTVRRALGLISLLLALCALAVLIHGDIGGWVSLCLCLTGFFAGCSVASAIESQPSTLRPSVTWLSAGLLLAFLALKADRRFDPIVYLLSGALIASLVLTRFDRRSPNALLECQPIAWLGARSYSLYMTHAIVIWVSTQVFRVFVKRPEKLIDGLMVPQLSLLEATVTNASILAVSLVLAALTYRFIEAPARRWSRRVVAADAQTAEGAREATARSCV